MTKFRHPFFIAIGYSTDFLMRSIVIFALLYTSSNLIVLPEDGSVQLILCTQELRKREFLPHRTK